MHAVLSLFVAAALQGATPETDSIAAPRGPLALAPFRSYEPDLNALDSTSQRPRAIEHSDFYYVRLGIHRHAATPPTGCSSQACHAQHGPLRGQARRREHGGGFGSPLPVGSGRGGLGGRVHHHLIRGS